MKAFAGSRPGNIPLSIVLCTCNRGATLERCLEKLDAAAVQRHGGEIVLVDNASTDNTPVVLETWAATAPCPVFVVREPRGGLSHARNTGLLHACGEVIIFHDDDCYLADGYIDHVMAKLPHARYSLVGGQVRNFDMSESQYGTNDRSDFEEYGPGDFLKAGAFQGTNFAMKRKVYEAIGGFETFLGAGAGTPFRSEDIDYFARALRAGFYAAHLPELLVFHHHGRQVGEGIRKLDNANAIAAGAYYMKFILQGQWNYFAGWLGTFRMNFKKKFLREVFGALLYIFNRPEKKQRLLSPPYPGVTSRAGAFIYKYLRMPFFRLRTPRRMVSHCIGTSKSGTHSVWLLFHGALRAMHELEDDLMIQAALGKMEGTLTKPRIESFIKERDRRVWLELDSSNLNIHFLPELLQLHPNARFVLTVRSPRAWVDSEINHFLAHPFPDHWRKMWDLRYRASVFTHPPEEALLAERGLYTLDGYLRYWVEHNQLALDLIPREQLLILNTKMITPSISKLANFLDVEQADVWTDRAHSFGAAAKFGIIDSLDSDYVDRKVDEICGGLMKLFPTEVQPTPEAIIS